MDYSSGGYYQPPDNNNFPPQNYGKQKFPHFIEHSVWLREKRTIRSMSSLSAISILAFILLSSIMSGALQGLFLILQSIPSFNYDAFAEKWNSAEFTYAFDALYSVFIVGIPFFAVGRFAEKKGYLVKIPAGKPKNTKMLPAIIFGSFGLCLFGNIIIAYLDTFVNIVTGVELEMPELPMPQNSVIGILIYFIGIAVVPALVEEFALRGVIMQMLRRYGDGFAIITSALIFGLMHCNLQQIPFAFIAGSIIGYAVITTDSLWTGVIIHFLNNAYSAATTLISDKYGLESPQAQATTVVFYAIIAIGFVCAVAFFKSPYKRELKKSPLVNQGKDFYGKAPVFSARISSWKLLRTYLFTAPMIIAYIAVIYQTIAVMIAL